ncbi:MAG: prephenate dehydrogenase [Ruminococcaceae bacterium]|nr:prephenate dehydrogenase [Oscillospiraceae bacterium]
MKIGILGLGLIGGSLAKAYKAAGHEIFAYDIDRATMEFASVDGVYDHCMDETNIGECEAVLLAVYPTACMEYLEKMSPHIAKTTLVMDMGGTKRYSCEIGFALAEKYGYTFVGGHPMAGTQFSGYKYASADLFRNAPMVVVTAVHDDIRLYERIKDTLAPMGFGKLSYTTAEKHDETIAFTSQLAHVVSNAYVKSPTAKQHKGFSAGSYKDLTRVAWLNEKMWTELFLENRDCLIREIDTIICSLNEYKTSLEQNNAETLEALLRDGRIAKEEIDGGKE